MTKDWRHFRVAVFAERRDGHAGALAKALRDRGADTPVINLRDCGMSTEHSHGLSLPGFGAALPAGAIVRGVPAGSFEQVTVRLGVLHALRELRVPVWNDARAIEACIDKSMTSHLFAKAGLPTPPTFTAQTTSAARGVVERELANGPLVLKPLFGSQGRGLRLIERMEDLPPEEEVAGLYYLQRFVEPESAWQDYRVFVVDGEAIAGLLRIGQTWVTNIRQGAAPKPLALDDEMRDLAVKAAAATGANYAGVDLIRGRSRRLQVLEVNSMPAWAGLQEVNPGLDIAAIIAEKFLAAVEERADADPR
jgi:RimK family alpha-L-glutamate ligase